jgi:hypothetical protein
MRPTTPTVSDDSGGIFVADQLTNGIVGFAASPENSRVDLVFKMGAG